MKVIIYPNETTGITLIAPCGGYSAEEIALKRVPSGVKYKIVNESDLPDNDFRNAWEFDFTTDFDGVGA